MDFLKIYFWFISVDKGVRRLGGLSWMKPGLDDDFENILCCSSMTFLYLCEKCQVDTTRVVEE